MDEPGLSKPTFASPYPRSSPLLARLPRRVPNAFLTASIYALLPGALLALFEIALSPHLAFAESAVARAVLSAFLLVFYFWGWVRGYRRRMPVAGMAMAFALSGMLLWCLIVSIIWNAVWVGIALLVATWISALIERP